MLLATAEDAGRAVDMFNGYEWMTRVLEVRPDRMGAGPASDESVGGAVIGSGGGMGNANGVAVGGVGGYGVTGIGLAGMGVQGALGVGVAPGLGHGGMPRFPSGGSTAGGGSAGGSASPFLGGFGGVVDDPSLAGRSLFVGNVSSFYFSSLLFCRYVC